MNHNGSLAGRKYAGITPAIIVPFKDGHKIDEVALGRLANQLARHDGIAAILTNGHTGEVFALTSEERAAVTRIVADALGNRKPVISAVACEGIADAVRDATMAKEAGADAVMVMPPHHWLRFGYSPDHALQLFDAIAKSTGLDLVIHVYPAWTRASYSSDLLAQLARLPYVRTFKLGTRDMNRYARDINAIRAADSTKTILTCHDEYLLPSMVQGVDGALVGFASFIPQLICELWSAVKVGDLATAMKIQGIINPLKDVVYGLGEPTGEAHARLKVAMRVAGIIEDSTPRPPTTGPDRAETENIRLAVEHAGLLKTSETVAVR